MSTGIEAWKNLAEIGPIYPFVGTEVALVVIGVVLWIGWHVMHNSAENRHTDHAKEVFNQRKGK